jgi:hypothetical protein
MPDSDLNTSIETAANSFLSDLQTSSLKSYSDDVIDNCIRNLIDQVNGHAVAIWLEEQKEEGDVLTIAYNVGDKGHEVEGVISQSLESGLVSKAYKQNETICHQGFFKHKEQSTKVDQKLGQITAHQIAAPFQLFGKTIGAITVIQTLAAGFEQHSNWGFDQADINHFEASVEVIQRLFELNIIRQLAR